MKDCTKCKLQKTPEEFYKNVFGRFGLSPWCKACTKRGAEEFAIQNPERRKKIAIKATRTWEKRNPEKLKEIQTRRAKKTPRRLRSRLGSRVWYALKGVAKSAKTLELLGCPVIWLQVHLESLFRPGMDWENYGKVWQVDHVRPCASFDLTNPEQQRSCFHWTNLQPLFVHENLIKGSSWVHYKKQVS